MSWSESDAALDGWTATAERIARLGNTDLDVFGLCLGGNVFGWTIDEQRSFEVLDAYLAAGGNFIDTSNSYGRRGPGGAGESERIIGRWIAARGNREQLVIATKVGMRRPGLARATVQRGRRSLAAAAGHRSHRPLLRAQGRRADAAGGDAGGVRELIDDGLIAYAAASNYSAERFEQALRIGERDGMASYVALQPQYNLMERDHYERELAPVCERHGIACLPYFALAQGFLTGKYRRDGAAVGSERASGVRRALSATSAASRCSTRSTRLPPSTARRSPRWRSPGCANSRPCSRRSPARLRPSSSSELLASVELKLSARASASASAKRQPDSAAKREHVAVGVFDRQRIELAARRRSAGERVRRGPAEPSSQRVERVGVGELEVDRAQPRRVLRRRRWSRRSATS